MRFLSGAVVFLLFLVAATCVLTAVEAKTLRQSAIIQPKWKETKPPAGTMDDRLKAQDVVTCKLKDCEPMCVCQKIVWSIEFNPTLREAPTKTLCNTWLERKLIEDKCITKCISLSQNVLASAGADDFACFSAVAEIKAIESKPSPHELTVS